MKVSIINKSKHSLPSYETEHSAGMDLRANLDEMLLLHPMQRALVPTGLFMELPDKDEAQIRPHTLPTPKPLLPVAGKPIVQWLVEDIVKAAGKKVEEIAYIIGDFGKATENSLIEIAAKEHARATIYYQQEALGTGHAILCA